MEPALFPLLHRSKSGETDCVSYVSGWPLPWIHAAWAWVWSRRLVGLSPGVLSEEPVSTTTVAQMGASAWRDPPLGEETPAASGRGGTGGSRVG